MTPDRWVDFFLNVVTEALGILITVFFVDRLIKRREEARWKPTKHYVYSKLLRFTSTMLREFYPLQLVRNVDMYTYVFHEYNSGEVNDITHFDLGTETLKYEMGEFISLDNGERLLRLRGDLLVTRRELSSLVNDSGFYLEPELLSLILVLDDGINSVLKALSKLENPHLTTSRPRFSIGITVDAIFKLFAATQNMQKWLIAQSTRRLTTTELFSMSRSK